MTNLKPIGAHYSKEGTRFRVWAPRASSVELVLDKNIPMQKNERGYFESVVPNLPEGSRYKFRINGDEEFPDPASRSQPEGPHGRSEVVGSDFPWTDYHWQPPSLNQWVIYELHVGSFCSAGTFSGIEKHVSRLKNLGVNVIEIMPIAQFSGTRNWGYDGVGLFAPQNSYGNNHPVHELKSLINACHEQGIAVILDVVYNHLGPEGNYLPLFGPYFQDKYKTPWGEALNFDGAGSDEVRNYFLNNAQQWLEEFHFDGLRLDAIHAILDTSAKPFLSQLTALASEISERTGKKKILIAESESNDPRILRPVTQGGLGLDGQWADDLHHVIHTLLTKENHGYYADYGQPEQLQRVFERGLLFEGQYSPHRQRSHGASYQDIERHRLMVCVQNHDQIGNRQNGDRFSSLVSKEKLKAAACWMFLSGGMPLIFMGEEYAIENPFLYFVDHQDPGLKKAVREGRKKEFADWEGEAPDPFDLKTFESSRISWSDVLDTPQAQEFAGLYKELIYWSKLLRREKFYQPGKFQVQRSEAAEALVIQGRIEGQTVQICLCISDSEQVLTLNPKNLLFKSDESVHIMGDKLHLPAYGVAVVS